MLYYPIKIKTHKNSPFHKPARNRHSHKEQKMATIQEFYGEHFAKFSTVNGGMEFAETVYRHHIPMNKYHSSSVTDVLVQNNTVAVLINERNWGDSGGVEWNIEVELKHGQEKAFLRFNKVRNRSGSKYDLPQFWHSTIKNVECKDGFFLVQFTDDKFSYKIPAGKKISVHKKSGATWADIVYNEITRMPFSEKESPIEELEVWPPKK